MTVETISEPRRTVPVAATAGVVVAGGGPGGIVAAIAAARTGADTLLIERYGFVGGMATAGLMTGFNGFRNEHAPNHVQTVKGIAQELVERLAQRGGAGACTAHGRFEPPRAGWAPYAVSVDPEILKHVALDMLQEAGVRLMLHTLVVGAVTDGRDVSAVLVESKSGRQAVVGCIYVDATGDADLCARAGARCEQVSTDDPHLMAMTLMYRVTGIPEPALGERRLYINGVTTRWGTYVRGVDGTDVCDLTAAEVQSHKDLEEHLARLREEYGPQVTLVESATTIGVRETRRVVGLYTITEEDALSGHAQPDAIAISANPVPGYYGRRRFLDHPGFEIPYRSLVPADLDNVLLAGRCISAEQVPFQSARSMAPAMAISQATGTAAALCAARRVRPADLVVEELQERLARDGAVVRIPPEERG